jgi:hypothetical protein
MGFDVNTFFLAGRLFLLHEKNQSLTIIKHQLPISDMEELNWNSEMLPP